MANLEALNEHGETLSLYIDNMYPTQDIDLETSEKVDEFVENFEEAFQGVWESEKEYAWDFIESIGAFDGAPDLLKNYFDIDYFTRDLFISDCYALRTKDNKIAVFLNI